SGEGGAPALASYPTRRLPISDQGDVLAHEFEQRLDLGEGGLAAADHDGEAGGLGADLAAGHRRVEVVAAQGVDALGEVLGGDRRSEEHTSELQSRENLVCRLL